MSRTIIAFSVAVSLRWETLKRPRFVWKDDDLDLGLDLDFETTKKGYQEYLDLCAYLVPY